MASGSDDVSEKPHPASPRRRDDFRKDGKFPRARDATAVATIGGVVAALVLAYPSMADAYYGFAERCFGNLTAFSRGEHAGLLISAPHAVLAIAAPPALAAAVLGTLAGAAQAGFRFYPKLLKVDMSRLDPVARLKQVLSPQHALFELFIALFRVGIVGVVCYTSLRDELPTLLALTGAPVSVSIGITARALVSMTAKAVAALVVMAVIDYAKSYRKLEKEMRMSARDLKDEFKQYEQDPKLKGKLRQRAQEVSRQRIIAAVGKADMVVTNPTHVAVALRYGENDGAPTVVAKGHDELALRIRAEARKHAIPIIENRRLARALDAEVKLGHPIDVQHYVAVAEVLAFVYQLRGGAKRRS